MGKRAPEDAVLEPRAWSLVERDDMLFAAAEHLYQSVGVIPSLRMPFCCTQNLTIITRQDGAPWPMTGLAQARIPLNAPLGFLLLHQRRLRSKYVTLLPYPINALRPNSY
ncbi:unnamed protein product [Haemonchus placei]|uniref:AraC family transcriptional regulator n=1 Tax=Haemonchus placei TaxID=6290 RepID=A0A0N4WLX7_HAEPC|nr:unnamed protein product [Haemonchus placei]